MLEWNDSRGVILSSDGTTPGKSFGIGMERLQGSPFVLECNDSKRVFLSRDRTTPRVSFSPGMERLQVSHSVLG